MLDMYKDIATHPDKFRQLNCRDSLMTMYNCPLEQKFVDIWNLHNYVIYVTEGRKIWHTAHGSYDLTAGSCVFVRKGACIVEQFFEHPFCLVLFFLPDEFIVEAVKSKANPISKTNRKYNPVIPIDKNEKLEAYFNSVLPYFNDGSQPDLSLLELKFRELILTIADNPKNTELISFFHSLLNEPQTASLQRVMEDNYCYNLKLETYAQLSNRSLSAFKRDFEKLYQTTPGKWLLEKRLNHARHLLSNTTKPVSEVAFESGFENPAHFSRAFRNHFGMAPSSVKQQVNA